MDDHTVQKGTVDQVKVRVRTHNPQRVWEIEVGTIYEAIEFLKSVGYEVV